MSKKKKHRTLPSAGKAVTGKAVTGKAVTGKAPMSKQKRMKPLSRGLLITAVVLIALAEVLLRVDLIGEQVNTAMYIAALVAAVAAVFVEFSGLGRNKMDMD